MELYNKIKRDLILLMVSLIIVGYIGSILNISIDDTDKDGFNRSGFQLLTDYGTGKEYLYRSGIIIERNK